LIQLAGKEAVFEWGPAQETAFEDLKKIITEKVTLAFPGPNKPYTITNDASDFAIGAMLSQWDKEHKLERPLTFILKTLSPLQTRYSTTEKELWAMVYALDRFRPYVHGRPFKCITDHRALLWMCGKCNPSCRLARWCQQINTFTNAIQFVKGKNNRVADALSRQPFVRPEEDADKNSNNPNQEDGRMTISA
jgi:hypothetical protein